MYLNPEEVASTLRRMALPGRLFDSLVVGTTPMTVLSWSISMPTRMATITIPHWIEALLVRLYVVCTNRLYLDQALHISAAS